jgi:hypothetical protein
MAFPRVACTAPSHSEHVNSQAQDAAPTSCAAQAGSHANAENLLNASLSRLRSDLCVCLCCSVCASALLQLLLQTRSQVRSVHMPRSPRPWPRTYCHSQHLCRSSRAGCALSRASRAPVPGATGLATVVDILLQRSHAAYRAPHTLILGMISTSQSYFVDMSSQVRRA